MHSPTSAEIKQARRDAGLTQTEAAKVVNFTKSGWQRWEQDERKMHPAFWELFLLKTGLKKEKEKEK